MLLGEVSLRVEAARRREGLRAQLNGPTAAGLMYSDTGGDGPVVVLLHGVLMGGSLWDTVVGGLRDRYRCIVPELPFGAHTTPMLDDADLSLPALATLIAEFLTELDLHRVTLVCNDPSPPSAPCPSGGFPTTCSEAGSIRIATIPRSAARPTSATSPNPSCCSPGPTSSTQHTFAGSVLIIWARDNKLMPSTHAERLADHFQNTQLVWIDDSRTLIPIDQPEILTEHLHTFLGTHS